MAKAADQRTAIKERIHTQQKRFYHADGYIKAIGHAAYQTIYSSNEVTRLKFTGLLKRLETNRRDARNKILSLKKRLQSLNVTPWPPHHQLWLCIHNNEGPWDDTSPPYTGGLQMHLHWGGLSNAGYYTQLQQEWAAENQYKKRGVPMLYQEWFNWDNADYCIMYA